MIHSHDAEGIYPGSFPGGGQELSLHNLGRLAPSVGWPSVSVVPDSTSDAPAGGAAGWVPRCAELVHPDVVPALVRLPWGSTGLHPQVLGFVTSGVLWLPHSFCVLWLFFIFLNIV